MTFRLILDECREKFGAPPRKLPEAEREAFRFDIPLTRKLSFWLGHPLARLQQDSATLIDSGRIVWSYVVAADEKLRSAKNRHPQTAIVLFGADESVDDRADLLERVGQSLDPKSSGGAGPVELSLGKPPLSKAVPANLSEAAGLFVGGTLLSPATLPGGRLERALLPILIAPERTKQVLALPSRWWSEALVAYWTESPEGSPRT